MNTISIQFYDQKRCINPDTIRNNIFQHQNVPTIFQHQVHGNQGLAINQENVEHYKRCLMYDSDYLITNLSHMGIGVLTADCLPIALADKKHKAIGIVHAGWRVTIGKITINAINHMNQLYGTQPEDLQIYFGPCALPCCYEVDENFIQNLPQWAKSALQNSCFDLISSNEQLLKNQGILTDQIDKSACQCTICNHSFCSHRKTPTAKTRQMSIIWLN